MKKIVPFLVVLLIIPAGIAFFLYSQKEKIISEKLEKGLESLSGLDAELSGIKVSLEKGFPWALVTLEEVRLKNPAEFQPENFAVIRNIQFQVKCPSLLLRQQWEIDSLQANIFEVRVEKNAQGKVNLAELPALKERAEALPSAGFLAAEVVLTLGVFDFYDYSVSEEPEPQTFDLEGQKEVYRQVRNADILIQAPALKIVNALGRGSLGIRRGKIQENMARHSG